MLAATLLFVLWPRSDAALDAPRPAKKFDASVVPLLDDDTRRVLASDSLRPDHKALAIGGMGEFHVADGAASVEKAREAALQGCFGKLQRHCGVYAISAA